MSNTLTVPVVEAPVTGSVTTGEPEEGATVSPGPARRPARFETKTEPLATTTPNGATPTLISFSRSSVLASMMASVLLRLKATYARRPSGEKAMPVGRGWPLRPIRVLSPGIPNSEILVIRMLSGPVRVVSLAHSSRSPGRKAMPA